MGNFLETILRLFITVDVWPLEHITLAPPYWPEATQCPKCGRISLMMTEQEDAQMEPGTSAGEADAATHLQKYHCQHCDFIFFK